MTDCHLGFGGVHVLFKVRHFRLRIKDIDLSFFFFFPFFLLENPTNIMPHQTTTLYITHLDDRVTEKMLKDIFSMISPVQSVKLNVSDLVPLSPNSHERLPMKKGGWGVSLVLASILS
jgi:hypothetical protein